MKILIIEDDEILNKALKASLEKEGYTVDCILDGEEGRQRINMYHESYDLVILDLLLPGCSGADVCRDARDKDITIPIMVLTGLEDEDTKVSILDSGADDYLTKPFSVPELTARVRAILRRPHQSLSPILEIASLSLDPTNRKVFRNQKEVALTLKEFKLLEHFMRHPNQVITRDQILEHVWDFNFDSFSNLVDVHINKLRKKINEEGGVDVIETVRGVGYRLVA